MLERFTERARRVIFFARYEASQYGSPTIESFHLLLGLARENSHLCRKLGLSLGELREAYADLIVPMPPISTSVEVPLSTESKKILSRAAEEADNLGHRHIGPEHLLLAMFVESEQIRTVLKKFGLTKEKLDRDMELLLAETLKNPSSDLRESPQRVSVCSGIGYDLHRLEAGRKLIIGGIEVPFDKGPAGHSDGDVLIHAMCDALLGAAGMGDIGTHFPDTDPKWKGANSLIFLEHIRKLLGGRRIYITNIDAVVILERPKLGPHFPAMRHALAKALGIGADQINLKAKTNEGVDAIGRGEAIAAHVVANVVI